ncbi:MAG: site-specific DNA-methyltransferase [Chloroflexia bacterium]
MSPQSQPPNALYFGDNLNVLRRDIPSESVDLVYLDPPFNSNRTYNLLFKEKSGQGSAAQLEAFGDTWQWDRAAAATFDELRTKGPSDVRKMINALYEFVGPNDMMAYLVMMAARLVEMHRVLKPTGGLYLHCDSTVCHYMRVILDTIFEPQNFRSQISWKRTYAHNDPKNFGNVTDIILYYVKCSRFIWNKQYIPYSQAYLDKYYRHTDQNGRKYQLVSLRSPQPRPNLTYVYKGYKPHPNGWAVSKEKMQELDAQGRLYFPANPDGAIREKMFLDEMPGVPLQNLWDDIGPISAHAAERLGYPTQKPLALLERIIQASSNPGDVVLDPFAGCGTAVVAAQKLDRRWIGIDITHLAIALLRSRLRNMFGDGIDKTYRVIGEPEDLESARALARESEHDGRYQFQWWALSLVDAQPEGGDGRTGKKGADRGIDGRIPFIEADSKMREAIVSVKSGHVTVSQVRDLAHVVDREPAGEIGVFITLEAPTSDMRREAAGTGMYHSQWTSKSYPRLQILTIEDLLVGRSVEMPPTGQEPGAIARRVQRAEGTQGELELS